VRFLQFELLIPMSNVVPFALLTAFSSSVHGGNPAAVVFLDLNLPTDTLGRIARNLNQPITTFLFPTTLPSNNDTVAAFGVRWFFPSSKEIPLCGHGTLAAAKAAFERSDLVPGGVDIIELHTSTRGIVTARKIEGGLLEIQLPAASVEEVSPDDKIKYSAMLDKAFRRTVAVNYIGKGRKGFEYCEMSNE
jgi:PhzF family phenazine biosynthesis protein